MLNPFSSKLMYLVTHLSLLFHNSFLIETMLSFRRRRRVKEGKVTQHGRVKWSCELDPCTTASSQAEEISYASS